MPQAKKRKTNPRNRTVWWGKNLEKTAAPYRNREIKEKIKKAQKEPLNTFDLISLLKKQPNFLGIFSSDQIQKIKIVKFPCFLIVNIAEQNIKNGHWIALRIGRNSIELFDSLGGHPSNWGYYPTNLISFLQFYSFSHKFQMCKKLQTDLSQACGLYCVYFILFRNSKSFTNLLSIFSCDLEQNDVKLFAILNKLGR